MSPLKYTVMLQTDIQFLRGSKERRVILQFTVMQTHVLEIAKKEVLFRILHTSISDSRNK